MAMDADLSDSSASPEPSVGAQTQAPKRTADAAGLKPGQRPGKSVKRRASKACQCCRARKVRCNVVEHGAPCTNCRLDEVDCIVSESKRKKKWSTTENGETTQHRSGSVDDDDIGGLPMTAHAPYEPFKRNVEHTPHALYQDLGRDASATTGVATGSLYTPNMLRNLQRLGRKASVADPIPMLSGLPTPTQPSHHLPLYVRPLPPKLSADDILYLEKKGALTIPAVPLRDELLRCYVEFIHPFMPLLNIHDMVRTIDRNDGSSSFSLLLFQSIMFAGIASVDMRYLKAAGYDTRRDARREFFQKTRLLYDFDVEADRVSLIQSLLLMTYWYETPDDQKDSHHWMGIAVSLSHTIGLHRNPEKSAAMDKPRQRLWKRIWWSTYMRDRLVALGMRRPTRIKDTDFDVPMLELDDFETELLPEGPCCIPADCTTLRSAEKQRQLAIMCIEKAKLCVCISNVLSVQYSVLHNNHGVVNQEGTTTRTTMMLVANRQDPEVNDVEGCDVELKHWHDSLAEEAKYVEPTWADVDAGDDDLVLNRSLLHMIYYATLSALHRPQVLPSTAMPPRSTQSEQLEISRKAVRLAAGEITNIANRLYNLDLVRFLPTPGITVLLPAIIIHLLDIKAPDESTRKVSLQGFCQCMQIMSRLRDIYAAADYSTAFLEAAIRKAEIILPQKSNEVKSIRNLITSAQGLMEAGRRLTGPDSGALTPPPDPHQTTEHHHHHHHHHRTDSQLTADDDDLARKLNTFLASTPPHSDHQPTSHDSLSLAFSSDGTTTGAVNIPMDFEPDFDSMINLDAAGEGWLLDEGGFAGGESSGFTMEVDWLRGMKEVGFAAGMPLMAGLGVGEGEGEGL
ncbi:hypothetical protein LTR62_002056 [Meristemomyces frigidus]|uniref:Zn(2)-C6 fungal-type domain-containing protein n=1 Tax=Meristemomyces frigidus TaxID=1508187 RepID=A0AAN7TTD6_9PEZI|nr:hypothetical protein LTR62_002056 [Meristemomyces frigidus]